MPKFDYFLKGLQSCALQGWLILAVGEGPGYDVRLDPELDKPAGVLGPGRRSVEHCYNRREGGLVWRKGTQGLFLNLPRQMEEVAENRIAREWQIADLPAIYGASFDGSRVDIQHLHCDCVLVW